VQDIIDNLELDSDYYAKCTLVYFVSSKHLEFYNLAKHIVAVPQSAVKVKIEEHRQHLVLNTEPDEPECCDLSSSSEGCNDQKDNWARTDKEDSDEATNSLSIKALVFNDFDWEPPTQSVTARQSLFQSCVGKNFS
jgi:hypothetical protein